MAQSIENKIKYMIRLDIGDEDSTKYTNAQLNGFIFKAVVRLSGSLGWGYTYSTDENLISPAVDGDTSQIEQVMNLIVLQAECMIARREMRVAIGKGIRVRDGDSEVDLSAGLQYQFLSVEGKTSPCSMLKVAIRDWMMSGDGGGGLVVY